MDVFKRLLKRIFCFWDVIDDIHEEHDDLFQSSIFYKKWLESVSSGYPCIIVPTDEDDIHAYKTQMGWFNRVAKKMIDVALKDAPIIVEIDIGGIAFALVSVSNASIVKDLTTYREILLLRNTRIQ